MGTTSPRMGAGEAAESQPAVNASVDGRQAVFLGGRGALAGAAMRNTVPIPPPVRLPGLGAGYEQVRTGHSSSRLVCEWIKLPEVDFSSVF